MNPETMLVIKSVIIMLILPCYALQLIFVYADLLIWEEYKSKKTFFLSHIPLYPIVVAIKSRLKELDK